MTETSRPVVIIRLPYERPSQLPDNYWNEDQDYRLWRCISEDAKVGRSIDWERVASLMGCSPQQCIERSQVMYSQKLATLHTKLSQDHPPTNSTSSKIYHEPWIVKPIQCASHIQISSLLIETLEEPDDDDIFLSTDDTIPKTTNAPSTKQPQLADLKQLRSLVPELGFDWKAISQQWMGGAHGPMKCREVYHTLPPEDMSGSFIVVTPTEISEHNIF